MYSGPTLVESWHTNITTILTSELLNFVSQPSLDPERLTLF